jgi:hypothetical protein
MIGLDLRKMMFAFMGILFTVLLLGLLTFAYAQFFVDPVNVYESGPNQNSALRLPESFTPHAIYYWFRDRWMGFEAGEPTAKRVDGIYDKTAWIWGSYTVIALLLFMIIWSYFGGAIARSAACEIAREGERIESSKAIKYAGQRFWSFFGAPLICVLGFLFFFVVTYAAGLIFRVLDFMYIGAPLAAILIPLAILGGFVMALIAIGTLCGFPLFLPAVAVEGTDAFDAFSRGFSYIYSRPWHYLWYQIITVGYGYVCIAFVLLFTVFMTHMGLCAGATGFDTIQGASKEKDFQRINGWAWSYVMSERHREQTFDWSPSGIARTPRPYGRLMNVAANIAKPEYLPLPGTGENGRTTHSIAAVIVLAWLIVVMGLAYSFGISYLISQQTMIYFILRKKVDEIEIKEIFFEEEAEHLEASSNPPAGEKPAAPAEKKPEDKKS